MPQSYPILVEALTQIAASNDGNQISEIARNAARRILSPAALALIQSGAGMPEQDGRSTSIFPAASFAPVPAITAVAGSGVGGEAFSTNFALAPYTESFQTSPRSLHSPMGEVAEFRAGGSFSDALGEIVAAQTLARAASAAISRCVDIGTQIEASEHLRLERDEVRHRLKNVYASAIGLANLSLPKDHSRDFARRLRALAEVHDFLDNESSDTLVIQVRELLAGVLTPYNEGEMPRISAEGPDIAISYSIAVALGLLANELATNALKHGSLSTGSGQVLVRWTCSDGEVGFWWREVGGPEADCAASPSQGSKLMRVIVERQLRGKMEHSITRSGLRFSVLFPMV
ncbi:sensor histidine kinase [Neorhizobium sp. BT27B]|uniref:sensor histidine kinase n=1 Tax=Neorhizobium sp. BT27B TaxID=3142625 RepID=UPI003D2C3EF1